MTARVRSTLRQPIHLSRAQRGEHDEPDGNSSGRPSDEPARKRDEDRPENEPECEQAQAKCGISAFGQLSERYECDHVVG